MSLDELVEWTAERVLRQREQEGEDDPEATAAEKHAKFTQIARTITALKGGEDLTDGRTHR